MRFATRFLLPLLAIPAAWIVATSVPDRPGPTLEVGQDPRHLSEKGRARAAPVRIEVFEFGLNPRRTLIKAGQAVVFKNIGRELHEIRPASRNAQRVFDRARHAGSSRPIFAEPGRYRVSCSIHPQIRGEIIVREQLGSVRRP